MLGLLGVAEAEIVADYQLTTRYRGAPRYEQLHRRRFDEAGVPIERYRPFLMAVPDTMRRTLRDLRLVYDGVESYVQVRCGVSAETVAELRGGLLDSAI